MASIKGGKQLFTHLFSPLQLKSGHVLRNRSIMGSMHLGLEDFAVVGGGLKNLAEFYRVRAAGGAGLIVTGGIAPNRAGKVSPLAGKMSNITEAVHEEGGLIAMQILHSGRYGYHPWNVAPSPIKAPIGWFTPRELSSKGKGIFANSVESTISDFVRCAELAKKAGYDGVEIMGSEGYLLNQFLVEHVNHRTDEWGGDYSNRMQTRQAVGDDFIIMFRLSMLDLINAGSTWDEIVVLAKSLEKVGVTIINTGIGWHEARVPTIATKVPRGAFTWVTEKMMKEVDIPLCATNRINSAEVAENVLAKGQANLISMALNTCIGCNQACLDFTFKAIRASCLVNPTAGYELELVESPVKPNESLNVAVIGAGPAGLAFSTTASRRGHKVTLFDSSNEIGGQFNMAKKIPGKEEFNETLRYYNRQLEIDGVDVCLSTTILPSDLIEGKFDIVVLATGVLPRKLDIPGSDHPKVLSYVDVLQGNADVGSRVAIIGAGGIGFDVAELLTHESSDDTSLNVDTFMNKWGVDKQNKNRKWKSPRQVQLLQRKSVKHGKNLGKTTGWIHRAGLKNLGVEMIGGVSYKKIDSEGNLHVAIKTKVEKYKIEDRVLVNDNIVICAGQESKLELEPSLIASGIKYFRIGGAQYAGELDANRAIDQGTRLALQLEVANTGDVFERPLDKLPKIVEMWRKTNPTGASQ
eukprot:GSMAST32.ASY1.ANO1.638.1 assembled CDS